jgi:hypothetical protein
MGRGAATCVMVTSAGRVEYRLLRVSRRWLLAVALVARAARAQTKVSQVAAQYQDDPRGGLSCAACTFFRRPRSCQVVEGDISPLGWCRLFDLPD